MVNTTVGWWELLKCDTLKGLIDNQFGDNKEGNGSLSGAEQFTSLLNLLPV